MPVYLCFNLFGIYQSEEITSIICEMGGALNVDSDVAVCLAVFINYALQVKSTLVTNAF